jgi:hypothetical protein
MTHLGSTAMRARRVIRCPACQLQICKSRESLPHHALRAADSNVIEDDKFDRERHAIYSCQTCEAVLVHSVDLMEPGWRQLR